MQFFAIVLVTVAAAIAYGVIHDQITVRVCLEYFTVTHPPLLGTSSPTLIALGWGLFSTWTAGIPVGFLLGSAARNGRKYRPIGVRAVLPYIGVVLVLMACVAAIAGFAGFFLAKAGLAAVPPQYAWAVPAEVHDQFIAVWWAHSGSYVAGIGGAIAAACLLFRKRQLSSSPERIRFPWNA
jgi:hypothetical protein